jgi:competence protein ComFA
LKTAVYQVGSKRYISIALQVDRAYWRRKKKEIQPLYISPSFGEAFYVWGQLESGKQISQNTVVCDEEEPIERWELWEANAADLFPFVQGRALLWTEIVSLTKKWKKSLEEMLLREVLQLYYLSGELQWFPGVVCHGTVFEWFCHRCLGKKEKIFLTRCASCGRRCATCEQCLLLGRSKTCLPFILFSSRSLNKGQPTNVHSLCLTPAQQKVNRSLVHFLHGKDQMFLLWAVTGAGKTEMLIPTLQWARSKGKKVCWTSPRKDVVLEITERLRHYLPEVKMISLYGGSPDLWSDGEIVVATAHQIWRFHRSFDLMIVDEVDAFPLYQNDSLEKGIKRAVAAKGKTILLTATPPSEWLAWSESGRLPSAILPVRYHGYPLPIPKSIYAKEIWKKIACKKTISELNHFIGLVEKRKGQGMIFVPGIRQVHQVVKWLHHFYPEKRDLIEGVYSQSSKRAKVISDFRNEKVIFLVTTTILERGVTVPACHVLVLGADHVIFDATSLMQIAGRVGRSASYQAGEVWFLATERTEAQKQAKKRLNDLNRLAKKAGFIKKGAYYQ